MLSRELQIIYPKKNESIRNYYNRFCKLVKDYRIPEDYKGLISRFIISLPVSFQDKLLMVKTANPMYALNSISAVAEVVIQLDANNKLISITQVSKNDGAVQAGSSKEVAIVYCAYHKWNKTHNTMNCTKLQGPKQSAGSIGNNIRPGTTLPTTAATTASTTTGIINTTKPINPNVTGGNKIICYLCGKGGHIIRQCPQNNSSNTISNTSKQKVAIRQVAVKNVTVPMEEEEEPIILDFPDFEDRDINV